MFIKKDSYVNSDTLVESSSYSFLSRGKTVTVFRLGSECVGFSLLSKTSDGGMSVYQYSADTGEDRKVYKESSDSDLASYSESNIDFNYLDQIYEIEEFQGEMLDLEMEYICSVLRLKETEKGFRNV